MPFVNSKALFKERENSFHIFQFQICSFSNIIFVKYGTSFPTDT